MGWRMANETKYVNVALNAYGQTTAYLCEIEGIKTGDFVIVPAISGEVTGRVMSYAPKKVFSLSLARTKKVIRRAEPKEINEVAELFGIAKNPAHVDDEDEGSFLTNSGYGTKELNKMMKKLQEKQEAATNDKKHAEQGAVANAQEQDEQGTVVNAQEQVGQGAVVNAKELIGQEAVTQVQEQVEQGTVVHTRDEQAEQKAAAKLQQQLDELEQKKKPQANSYLKDDAAIPGYWRYVAIGILALYFFKDYIFE